MAEGKKTIRVRIVGDDAVSVGYSVVSDRRIR